MRFAELQRLSGISRFAAAGAQVFVHGKTVHSADGTRDSIISTGREVEAVLGDLNEPGQGAALVETCERAANGLDILVINASEQINADLMSLTAEKLSTQIDVELQSTVEILQACLPCMAEPCWGVW